MNHGIKLLILLLFCCNVAKEVCGQLPFGLVDGIEKNPACTKCKELIDSKPPEVLFGIEIDSAGNIYFNMTNLEWFNKIFASDQYGLAVDIIAKSRYDCDKSLNPTSSIVKGHLVQPVYKPDLIKGNELAADNSMYVKIGSVPPNMRNQQLEGNLLILNGKVICLYNNFVNIERNVWQLLPMGLFTDTLVKTPEERADGQADLFTYSNKMQFVIPFNKNKTIMDQSDLKPMIDSLTQRHLKIKKIEIRAYASAEGPEANNQKLMKARAQSIVAVLKNYQASLNRYSITTAENWIDFFRDIASTKYKDWQNKSKAEIKLLLADKSIAPELEPMLYNQRKALVTLYMELASSFKVTPATVVPMFNDAVKKQELKKARMIQKALFDEIADSTIPADYINKLEIPMAAAFTGLASDRTVFGFLLKRVSEQEALEQMIALKKIDPLNGKINYNICALRLYTWQHSKTADADQQLLNNINQLERQGIDPSLVKRMRINYYILQCEDYYNASKYAEKDSALAQIHAAYQQLVLSDEEIFSISKYLTFYSQDDWAEALIRPRIDQLDVSEDLVFYYINLLFFKPSEYKSTHFTNALLNAINLDRQRFCNFFLPQDHGGASMQLLEFDFFKRKYCESCK